MRDIRDIQGDFIRNDYSEDFIDRFYKEAIKVAYGLRLKYKPLFLKFEFSHSFRKSVAALIRNSSSSIMRLVASVTPELVGGSKSSFTLRYI